MPTAHTSAVDGVALSRGGRIDLGSAAGSSFGVERVFGRSGEAWDDLLARSGADPLFNSPTWLSAWWTQYGAHVGGQLDIRALHDADRLMALAPFYRRPVRYRSGLRSVRLELLGTARGHGDVAFSERSEVLLDPEQVGMATQALVDELVADRGWDELVVSNTPASGVTPRFLDCLARRTGGYLRSTAQMEAWDLRLGRPFADILAEFGAGTRARIIGSRTRLAEAGHVSERLLGPDEFDYGWDVFRDFHAARWGKPFARHWETFYGVVGAERAKRGEAIMSVLEFDRKPISFLFNLRAGRGEYSMLVGFTPVPVKRVSPGWLHLGLALERACRDGMERFDFLGGGGRNEQYKAAFRGEREALVTLQLVRDRRLKVFFRAWDQVRRIRHRLLRPKGAV